MTIQKIRLMLRCKLWWYSSWFQFFTLIQVRWRGKNDGIIGYVVCILKIGGQEFVQLAASLMSRRGGSIFALWAWLRRIDEKVDGDQKLPAGIESIDLYLTRKEGLLEACLQNYSLPQKILPEDALLIQAFRGIASLGCDIADELRTHLRLFRFDASRRSNQSLTSADELARYTDDLEAAILLLSVKIFGGDLFLARQMNSSSQGVLQRIDFLVDILKDLKSGMINIPEEIVACFQINIHKLKSCRTLQDACRVPGFKDWHGQTVKDIYREWQSQREMIELNMKDILPSWLARIPFRLFVWKIDGEISWLYRFYTRA